MVDLLIRLHDHKTVGYADAWRKRGELLSIFANLARKYDRLVIALDEGVLSPDERLIDTAADLCIYVCKYLTWLAEQHPDAFNKVDHGVTSSECADGRGADAFARIMRTVAVDQGLAGDVKASWSSLKSTLKPLDDGFVAQAAGCKDGTVLSWVSKTQLAWDLSSASLTLLIAIGRQSPDEWLLWRSGIDALG